MKGIQDLIKTLGPARLAAMGVVAAILIGLFAVLIARISSPQMAPLFTGLDLSESNQIVGQLEGDGVPFELRADGAAILVPHDRVDRLRMRFAEEGLPSGGGVGYEVFDEGSTLGATSFVQNINRVRALEGELARTITSLSRVEAARVHLVLPERELFSRERQTPSASIVMRVRGTLESGQIRAIQHLVASAIADMEPRRVSIVDEAGRLLASGEGDDLQLVSSAMEERKLALERRLREEVRSIVESVVGAGRARVRVTSALSHNRMTETAELFDPEGRVLRSTQTREDLSSSNETMPQDGVTVGDELPEAEGEGGANGQRNDEESSTEEIVNYEISRTTRTNTVEPGQMERLSVAVLVDGVYERNDAGELVYQPRAPEEIDRIAALVRSAVGFDETRGDSVEIVNLRFAEGPRAGEEVSLDENAGWFDFDRFDMVRLIELAVLALLVVIVLVFALRPLLKRVLDETRPALTHQPDPAAPEALAPGAAPALAGPAPAVESKTQQMLDVAEMSSRLHAQSVGQIGEMINSNPNDAIAIIREWMHEAA